jgi:glutamate-ammonia-ligase adenylyltransferase
VILGLGRLGGEALTAASDLDLVYLYTGGEGPSEGRKPLGPADYFNRLASRVTAALSVPTAAGPLYDVDTRLRPQGAQGMLAVSLDGFERYQRDEAWTWEHMALTRARPVFGAPAARKRVAAVIGGILRQRRDAAKTLGDAVTMRAEMERHKPALSSLDVKLGPGGLVDLEFCVHVLQLTRGVGLDPCLDRALEALVAAGLLEANIIPAQQLLTRMLVMMRLVAPADVKPAQDTWRLVAAACGAADFDALLAQHDAARAAIGAAWRQMKESVE